MEALKLLPVEPDDAMIEAGEEEIASRRSLGCAIYASDVYEAMVRAYEPDPNPRPAAQPGVVKTLDWSAYIDPSEGKVHYGKGVFGHWYAVSRETAKMWGVNHHVGQNVHIGWFESFEEAKAAAQTDYERRILSALAALVSQEPVAKHLQFRRDAMLRAMNIDGSDFAGDLDAVDENSVEGLARTLAIVAAGYEWTLDDEGRLTGLVAGDQGYASTSITTQPLTDGEPSDAEVERAAKAIYESWENVPAASNRTWAIYCEKLPRGAEHFRAHARAALLAAKSKGGQADG